MGRECIRQREKPPHARKEGERERENVPIKVKMPVKRAVRRKARKGRKMTDRWRKLARACHRAAEKTERIRVEED